MLNFSPSEQSSKINGKKYLRFLIPLAAILLILSLRSTLAANINLNNNQSVEFGQGVTLATACDSEITVTPYASFVNESGAGSHRLTSIRISGVDSTANKCSGKTFVVKAYGDSGLLNLFNYTEFSGNSPPEILHSETVTAVEITDTNGDFSWISGGSDGDDITNVSNEVETETAFTINLSSIVPTTVRTPLASAADVKRITVETYDGRLLNNRVLTTSQIAFYLPNYSGDNYLQDGLPNAIGGPLLGGNYSGAPCLYPSCNSYITLSDWISRLTDDDMDAFNTNAGRATPLTRSQLNSALTFKFTFDPNAAEGSRWIVSSYISGEYEGSNNGAVWGFNGNTGAFLFFGAGQIAIFFSVNGALSSNSIIGNFTPYGDQPTRTLPIRDMVRIWNYSEVSYEE